MEAVNDCEEALKLDKNMVKLQVRRGRALLRLGHFTPAEESFQKVLQTTLDELLTAREKQDAEVVFNTQEGLDANKSNATLGIRDLAKLREYIKSLIVLEGQFKYKEALKISEDILKLAPYYRAAHISKASALCETFLYDEAKTYIENLTSQTHSSIQNFFAHPSASFPAVSPEVVQWKESAAEKYVKADLPATIQLMLCMGPDLASVYVTALKNITANRLYSADIMAKLATTLRGLATKLSVADVLDKWNWVQGENDKIQCLLQLKTNADEKFKAKNFKAALMAYSNAIKVRISCVCAVCVSHCPESLQIAVKQKQTQYYKVTVLLYVYCFLYFSRWIPRRASGTRSSSATARLHI